MAVKAKIQKVVSTLPTTLEKNTVYYVRVANGFDIYVTNNSGLIVAYPANYAQANHTHSNLVPYTGATQDLNLNTKNLIINGEISLGYSNAKVSRGTPIASSSYGLILQGYDGIELKNRSFYDSPTIFTMNGVEKARVQYNGDFLNKGIIAPDKGIIVGNFSPVIKQSAKNGACSLIFIKTGLGEDYYNMVEFKVSIRSYGASNEQKHHEFIVGNYFARDSTTNYNPRVTWVAGESNEITSIKFYKKDSGGYEFYLVIEGSFNYPAIVVSEAQATLGAKVLHPDVWDIKFDGDADLTNKSITHTYTPSQFKRDKQWLDANYTTRSWVNTQLSNYIPTSQKGVANGVATLDSNGLIPTTQLPSYVDDALEFANLASFPTTGETGKIYVALDTNLTYRWGGSSYIQIASGAVQSVNGQTGVVNLSYSDVGAEQAFTKNTAFNKNFGTTSGTVAQGDDSRILNGQTAYNWGNHADAGYAVSGWVYSNFQSLNNNLTGISDLNLTNSSVGLIKKISGPPGSNKWALDTSVYATESWTSTNYFPKSNLHGISISNTGGGAWIDMPISGYSAIGSGGQGTDAWIAKTVSNGQFFIDAIAGDLISRNTTGKIMWGNSSSYAAMYLQNNILTFLNTPKVGNNDIYHSGNFSLNGYATQTWVTNQGYITANDVPPVYNGRINYTGVGAIEGGGESTANQSVNTHYSFDLTQATKNNINNGVTAYGWGSHSDAGYMKIPSDYIHDGVLVTYDLDNEPPNTYFHNVSIQNTTSLDIINLSKRHTLIIRNPNSGSCSIKINNGSPFSINGYGAYEFYMDESGHVFVTGLPTSTSVYI